jgi:hypothetical protein
MLSFKGQNKALRLYYSSFRKTAFKKDVECFIGTVTSIWNYLVEGRWDMKYFKSSLKLPEINRNKNYAKYFTHF